MAHAPRWIRVGLMLMLFSWFFLGSPVIALILFPLLRLVSSRATYRGRCTYLLYLGMRLMATTARRTGIFTFPTLRLPEGIAPNDAFVLICNHPTFVDMVLLLGSFPHMTCVTHGRWSRHWALGRLLRSTTYLPGPGSGRPESEDMLGAMVDHLRKGHSLLVFPEGQRSRVDRLRRFRRGAVAAATAAEVPILPLYLSVDPPYLTKDVPLWAPPTPAPHFSFEWFDVIRPGEHGTDATVIHRDLEARYRRRFEAEGAS